MRWTLRLCGVLGGLALVLGAPAGVRGIEGQPADPQAPAAEAAADAAGLKLWSADDPLAWDDFRAAAPRGGYAAQTVWSWRDASQAVIRCTQAAAGWTCAAGFESARVQAVFLQEFSWANAAARGSRALLAHEQGHFDLAEAYAHGLAAELSTLGEAADDADRLAAEAAALERLQGAAEDAFEAWGKRAQAEQQRYDRETVHGTDAAAQARWAARIRALFAGLLADLPPGA